MTSKLKAAMSDPTRAALKTKTKATKLETKGTEQASTTAKTSRSTARGPSLSSHTTEPFASTGLETAPDTASVPLKNHSQVSHPLQENARSTKTLSPKTAKQANTSAADQTKSPVAQAPTTQLPDTSDRTTVTQKKSLSADVSAKPASAPATNSAAARIAAIKAANERPVAARTADKAAAKSAVEAKAAEAKSVEAKAAAAKAAKPASNTRQGFKTGEFIVYPAHGVGQILAIEEQEVAGFKLELFVISFIKDKMILKVPVPKVVSVGMRKLADADIVKKSLDTLTGRARVKRTMWSRRAQEYEAKINSGDLVSIAEVVRDLYRSDAQPEQSYSERQLYEAALDRMAREISVVQKITEMESLKVIEAQLQKGPRRGAKAETEEVDSEDADVEEAA